MPLPSKDVVCKCGHTTTLTTRKLICVKCGKYVFYNDAEKRRHQMNAFYMIAMLALGIGIITYLFMEMIVTPLLGR